jgi:hypothetical protein
MAFDVPNGTTLNVFQILKAVNRHARNGVLYDGDKMLRQDALEVLDALN